MGCGYGYCRGERERSENGRDEVERSVGKGGIGKYVYSVCVIGVGS